MSFAPAIGTKENNMTKTPIRLLTVCVLVLAVCPSDRFSGKLWAAETTAPPEDVTKALGGVPLRYAGPRWTLLYGSYEGVEQFAVNELQRMVQRSVPYVLEVLPTGRTPDATRNLILVGTPATNPRIAELGRKGLVKLPTHAEGYTIACLKSPEQTGTRLVVIAGTDASGVLYGVVEFNKKLATLATHDKELRAALDAIPEFTLTESPTIENRGVWTWGYVIYDYKRFFDNMARLKMNRLTVWNDRPPVNCRQFIDYAHSRGIKVILGYSWGYALAKLDPTNPQHLQLIKAEVLKTYEDLYRDLGMDGIYFQTFTEQSNTMIGGRSIAGIACDWVNDIAGALLKKHPRLRIEWGLHASSIQENYVDLKKLDPRLTIVWEDAGGLPFNYDPEAPPAADSTLDYSRQLATFRPGSEFAMCAKGWIQMRWATESEPHGDFIIGERGHEFIRDRLQERQPRWDYVNAKWITNYPISMRFYSTMRAATPAPITVVGLVDDGMFEERIQVSLALLGEMLWNPNREEKAVLEAAMSPYYRIVQ
jgi:hypothetical protein